MTGRLARVPGITPPHAVPEAAATHMLYTCLVDSGRDAVLDFLLGRGIEARLYFPPAHLQPIFPGPRRRLPVTEDVAGRMISLPMHAQLTGAELAEIAAAAEDAVQLAGR
jgi:perosamine synthetase